MGDRYRVRDAAPQDIDEIVKMRLRLQKHMADRNPHLWQMSEKKIKALPEFYRRAMEEAHSRLLVVENKQSESVVGMGLGRIYEHHEHIPDKSGKLDDIWIDPHHRRRGLCRRVVFQLLQFFRSNNIQCVLLNYVKGNMEAEAVWRQLGFNPVLTTATAKLSDVERTCRKRKT